MKDYKKILEGVVNIINTTEKSDIGFSNICAFIGENCPELAESEDERIRKEIISLLQYTKGRRIGYEPRISQDDMIAWLEKLGYKPQGKTALEAAKEEKVDNANKAEPKFHEGDWITNGVCTTQIDSVDDGFYWHDNNRIGGRIDAMNKAYHLWSINDAKDGDILVNGSNIFIFSHFSDIARVMGYCHINLDDGRFYDDKDKNECFGLIDTVFSPTTEEQRDHLFAKMKEAGYEWDAENKELKKIEQKLANSENIGKNDTLLDLLQKMPSCVTVDGLDYHFVMKKTIAFMAFYEGEGQAYGKVIFWMAGEPIELLTAMLNKLKEEGLLDE